MARIHCLGQNAAVGGSNCCPRMEFPCSAVRAPLSRTTSDRRVLTKTGPSRRAGASALHMISVARQVWPSAGGDHLDNADGAPRTLDGLRTHPAPKAAVSIFQRAAPFSQLRRTDQTLRTATCFGERRSPKWKWAQPLQNSLYPYHACRMVGFLVRRSRWR